MTDLSRWNSSAVRLIDSQITRTEEIGSCETGFCGEVQTVGKAVLRIFQDSSGYRLGSRIVRGLLADLHGDLYGHMVHHMVGRAWDVGGTHASPLEKEAGSAIRRQEVVVSTREIRLAWRSPRGQQLGRESHP